MRNFFSIIAILASALNFGCAGQAKYKTVNNKEFSKLLENPEVQLVDVRTPDEYAQSHIPGAVNINVQLTTFEDDIQVLDPSKPVAVYCRSGVRSVKASEILADKGYTVYNLKGGILGWDGPKDIAEDEPEEEPVGNHGYQHSSE